MRLSSLIPQLFLLVAMLPATMAAPGANMNDEHAPRALVGLPSSTCELIRIISLAPSKRSNKYILRIWTQAGLTNVSYIVVVWLD